MHSQYLNGLILILYKSPIISLIESFCMTLFRQALSMLNQCQIRRPFEYRRLLNLIDLVLLALEVLSRNQIRNIILIIITLLSILLLHRLV